MHLLQWGHRANAVERKTHLASQQAPNPFNGATARTRWNVTLRAGLRALAMILQWGHRANAVERPSAPAHTSPALPAFNGATARTRWNVQPWPGVATRDHPSMGPPRERGGTVLRVRVVSADVAPSMGPPRERGGTLYRARELAALNPLQWGHRANAVERVVDEAKAAGMSTCLQWGHRANAVERMGSQRSGPTRTSFNGATARTRWNGSHRMQWPSLPSSLQWGHRANAVERSRRRRASSSGLPFNGATARTRWNGGDRPPHGHRLWPFNGATARTRWNAGTLETLQREACLLQWGHRANAVERWSGVQPKASRNSLQWGHRANAVERSQPGTRAGRTGHPFNGATARTRWNGRRSRSPRLSCTPFNGATARTRWNAPPGRCSLRRHATFNGATARTRWNAGTRAPGIARAAPLQWGHRANAVERPTSESEQAGISPFNGATARTRWNEYHDHASLPLRAPFNGATARTRWNVDAIEREMAAVSVLQWGHRANAVERYVEALITNAVVFPSMGPPRERGGTPWVTRWKRPPGSPFNGATARTRWNALEPGRGRDARPPFNGATARTRWNERAEPGLCVRWVPSMGPPRERGGTA